MGFVIVSFRGYVLGIFVEREIILFGLTNNLFICRWDHLKIVTCPR